MTNNALVLLDDIYFQVSNSSGIPLLLPKQKKSSECYDSSVGAGKKAIKACCSDTANFMLKAVEVGIRYKDLFLLQKILLWHNLDEFRKSKYKISDFFEIDIEALIDEIFEQGNLFESKEISVFFLKNFPMLVKCNKRNQSDFWAITLAKFLKNYALRLEKYNNKSNLNFQEIRYKVENGNLSQALQIIKNSIQTEDSSTLNEVSSILSRHSYLEHINNSGQLFFPDYDVTRNKIVKATIALLSRLENKK